MAGIVSVEGILARSASGPTGACCPQTVARSICARIESPKRCGEAGWLHRLRDEPFLPARRILRSVALTTTVARYDLASLASGYREAVNPAHVQELARSLGLSVDSLNTLGIGWSACYRAWSFPMTDASGSVLGIRLRRPNGYKFAVRGGHEGLFIPQTGAPSTPLLICEGPTDTAALIDMGFPATVGRPSCTGGIKLLVELIGQRHLQDVVIVADGDAPGQRGAENLASVLVAYTPIVRVIQPPPGIKDARAWLQMGGTHRDIQQVIDAAPLRRLAVRAIAVGKDR